MFPAFLIRTGVDWVRHNQQFKSSNPYSRCEEAIRICQSVWQEQYGQADLALLEPATVSAYWAEFFHAEDMQPDEAEWKQGLTKASGQYDSFGEWQDWFQKKYKKVYKQNNIWTGVLMTSWAHTHQYEVVCTENAWEFQPAAAYTPTSEMWRLEPHMYTVKEILRDLWLQELKRYDEIGFTIDEQSLPYLGKVECLSFDAKRYFTVWPPQAERDKEELKLGEMVADIVVPSGDDWYRHLDNVIFAHDHLDVTALINRAAYVFGSRRRLLELTVDNGPDKALEQAQAEGWLVPKMDLATTAS